jgi:uncharacterized delta-60 repeat protein
MHFQSRFTALLRGLAYGVLLAVLVPITARSQVYTTNGIPGRLDYTFNPETRGLWDKSDPQASVSTLALQPDGKVLVGGARGLVRLNSDGSLDTSFQATTTAVSKLLALADGRVVVVYDGAGMARLNPDGTMDKSFKTPVWLRPGASVSIQGLALIAGGQLLIGIGSLPAGVILSSDLIRLNFDGSIDSGFQAAMTEPVGVFTVQPDGKIVLPGGTNELVRLNLDGTPDPSFVSLPTAFGWRVTALALATDGRLLVASLDDWNGFGSRISRFEADGSIDPTFLNSDPQTGPTGAFIWGTLVSLAPQPDGKILLAGTFFQGQPRQGFARLNADGTLDQGFAPWPDDESGSAEVSALAMSGSERLLIGGRFDRVDGITRYNVARIELDPPQSAGFVSTHFEASEGGGDAVITVERVGDVSLPLRVNFQTLPASAVAGVDFLPQAEALQFGPGDLIRSFTVPILDNVRNDGNRTVLLELTASAGGVQLDPEFRHAVLTIFDDEQGGNVDPSFKADVISPTAPPLGTMLAVQEDGRALVKPVNEPLSRLLSDGSLDPSFAPNSSAAFSTDWFLVRPNGKIVIGGTDGQNNLVGQLNENGSLDTSFQPLSSPAAHYADALVTLQPDGRLVVALGGGKVLRLNLDGSVDGTFKPHSFDGWPAQVSVDSIGRILLGGWFNSSVGLVRLHPDGSIDTSFKPAVSSAAVYSFALHQDSKIVLFGIDAIPNAPGSIVRLLPDGSRDSTFHPDFRVDDLIQFVPLPSGQTLLGGLGGMVVPNGLAQRQAVARVNVDGSLDRSFVAPTNFIGQFGPGTISAVAVQPDGAVLVLGQFISVDGVERSALVKLSGGGNPLQLVNPTRLASGRYHFDVLARPGHLYLIEAATDLLNWSAVSTNSAVSFDLPWEESSRPELSRRFYRARLIEP